MESNQNSSMLLYEQLLHKLFCFFRFYRIPFFSAIFFGMLAHGFAFTNKFINHDEIYNLFGKGATVDSGRWALGALDSVFPNYSMPWIYGIFTIVLIAVSVCLIVHVFSIRNALLQALLAGAIVVFPVWTSTFSFMFTSCAYGVAFLTAVLSVALLRQAPPLFWIPALGCGIFSVAIYQAYIAIIAAMLVLCLMKDLLCEAELLSTLRRGICYLIFLILTLGLYYVATQAVLILTDVEFNQYATERNSFQLGQLPQRMLSAYGHFFRVFEKGDYALIPTLFSQRMHRICFSICSVLLLIFFRVKRVKLPRILFLLALILVFPLAASCMYLFTAEAAIHTLVLCGFLSIYFPLFLMADLCIGVIPASRGMDLLRKAALNILLFAFSAIVLSNTYFANEAYLQLHLQYENTYAFYSSLLSDIRMHPEFDADTELAILGRWKYPDYFFRKFEFTYDLFGHLSSAPSEYSMDRFLEYYIGFPIPFAPDWETEAIQNSERFLQMPRYPYYGSIQMFDDTLVVKLS